MHERDKWAKINMGVSILVETQYKSAKRDKNSRKKIR